MGTRWAGMLSRAPRASHSMRFRAPTNPAMLAFKSLRPSAVSRLATSTRAAHVISTPTLINIEKRWEFMPAEEREDIVHQLAERQKVNWTDLTLAEKQAAWYISYGPWGPRKPVHNPGDQTKIFVGIGIGLAASVGIFALCLALQPKDNVALRTQSLEWQEKSNEILKEVGANPFTTYNQIQSPSKGPLPEEDEDDDE